MWPRSTVRARSTSSRLSILLRYRNIQLRATPTKESTAMRVMVIVKATKESEAGAPPDRTILTAMGHFNEELVKAGVMQAGEGLHPSSQGKRVHFSGTQRTVIDGPFAETKELIAGFWIWKVKSMDDAVEW